MDRRAIKLRTCGGYALLFVLLGSHVLSADSPPLGSYNLPSKKQTLTFLQKPSSGIVIFRRNDRSGPSPSTFCFSITIDRSVRRSFSFRLTLPEPMHRSQRRPRVHRLLRAAELLTLSRQTRCTWFRWK